MVAMPIRSRQRPPRSWKPISWRLRKAVTVVRPTAAMRLKIPSAVAAPRPVIKPARRPSRMERRMQSRPTGPTGAATAKPMAKPLTRWFIAARGADQAVRASSIAGIDVAADAGDDVIVLGPAGFHFYPVTGFFGQQRLAERRLVGKDMLFGVAVPGAEQGVADRAAGVVPQINDAADADLVGGGILEVGDTGVGK